MVRLAQVFHLELTAQLAFDLGKPGNVRAGNGQVVNVNGNQADGSVVSRCLVNAMVRVDDLETNIEQ
jgi:hypothetical protein